jgi:protein TonB
MSSYRAETDRSSRTKAIVGVIAVHAALAVMIVAGLNVQSVKRTIDTLKMFNLPLPPPPVRPPPPPTQKPHKAKLPEGAEAPKASPVVAPQPKLPVQSPIIAAKIAGTGSAATSGAGTSGNGTGAGGSGSGPGGGGDFSRFTPARRVTRIPDREYRRLAATGIASGSVGVTIKVNTDGGVSNCRVARSSGDPSIDGLMCRLTLTYVRFDPARDPSGRPVAQDVTFFPNWWRP